MKGVLYSMYCSTVYCIAIGGEYAILRTRLKIALSIHRVSIVYFTVHPVCAIDNELQKGQSGIKQRWIGILLSQNDNFACLWFIFAIRRLAIKLMNCDQMNRNKIVSTACYWALYCFLNRLQKIMSKKSLTLYSQTLYNSAHLLY